MIKARVPLLNIQTPQFITIRLLVPYKKAKLTSTIPFVNDLKLIGIAQGITVFSRDQRRSITKIYGFNGDEMQPLLVAPGSIDTSLILNRIVFHKTDFLQELGFIRGNLLTQENPFIIAEDQFMLREPTGEIKIGNITIGSKDWDVTLARTIFYYDCWIINNSISYDITKDDLIIIPSFTVEVGKVITSEETSTTFFEEIMSSFSDTISRWFSKK